MRALLGRTPIRHGYVSFPRGKLTPRDSECHAWDWSSRSSGRDDVPWNSFLLDGGYRTREMQNDALCDRQQRNCASWPGGAEKMVAVCGVGRRTLEMEVSRSPFAGTMMDSPWESSRCSESSRRVEETWFLGFEYFPTLCGKFRSDFNFFSGKKQRQLLLRKLNILEIPWKDIILGRVVY